MLISAIHCQQRVMFIVMFKSSNPLSIYLFILLNVIVGLGKPDKSDKRQELDFM